MGWTPPHSKRVWGGATPPHAPPHCGVEHGVDFWGLGWSTSGEILDCSTPLWGGAWGGAFRKCLVMGWSGVEESDPSSSRVDIFQGFLLPLYETARRRRKILIVYSIFNHKLYIVLQITYIIYRCALYT